jgi:hypothetical protein
MDDNIASTFGCVLFGQRPSMPARGCRERMSVHYVDTDAGRGTEDAQQLIFPAYWSQLPWIVFRSLCHCLTLLALWPIP